MDDAYQGARCDDCGNPMPAPRQACFPNARFCHGCETWRAVLHCLAEPDRTTASTHEPDFAADLAGWDDEPVAPIEPAISSPAAVRAHGPAHYRATPIQPWDAMEQWLPRAQFIGFLRGNAIKYLARAGRKGDDGADYAKAQHYLEKLNAMLAGGPGDA